MKLRYFILILIIILANNVTGYSQVTVTGSANAYPTNGITVALVNVSTNKSMQTITDYYGVFKFDSVSPGNYYLNFSGEFVESANTEEFTVNNYGVDGLRYVLTPTTPSLISFYYTASMLSGDYFVNLVEGNRAWFESDPEFYTCAEELSSRLISSALAQPSFDEAYERAGNIAANTGVPLGLARDVATEMTSAAYDMMQLANGMRELTATVREILRGNSNYYQTTQLFQYALIVRFSFSQLPMAGIDPDSFYAYIFNLSFHMTYAYTASVCQ